MIKDGELKDQRHFTRIPFDAIATMVNKNGIWHGALYDISLKGMLIAKPENWSAQRGDHFFIEIRIDGNDVRIKMDCQVAHIEPRMVGFSCQHIDLDSITHLRRLVELNVGDNEILNREIAELVAGYEV